jgi:hypothetical protein
MKTRPSKAQTGLPRSSNNKVDGVTETTERLQIKVEVHRLQSVEWDFNLGDDHPLISYLKTEDNSQKRKNAWLREAIFGPGRESKQQSEEEKQYLQNLYISVGGKHFHANFIKHMLSPWGVTRQTLKKILIMVPSEISRDEALAAIRAAKSQCDDWEASPEHIHPYIRLFRQKKEGAANGWLREAVFGTGRKGGTHTDLEKAFLLELNDSVTNSRVRQEFITELVFAWGSKRDTIDSILLPFDGSPGCSDSLNEEVVQEIEMAVSECAGWHPESRDTNPLVKLLSARNENNHSEAWLRGAVFGPGRKNKHISTEEKCYLQTLYTTGNINSVSREFLKELSFAWGATVPTLKKTCTREDLANKIALDRTEIANCHSLQESHSIVTTCDEEVNAKSNLVSPSSVAPVENLSPSIIVPNLSSVETGDHSGNALGDLMPAVIECDSSDCSYPLDFDSSENGAEHSSDALEGSQFIELGSSVTTAENDGRQRSDGKVEYNRVVGMSENGHGIVTLTQVDSQGRQCNRVLMKLSRCRTETISDKQIKERARTFNAGLSMFGEEHGDRILAEVAKRRDFLLLGNDKLPLSADEAIVARDLIGTSTNGITKLASFMASKGIPLFEPQLKKRSAKRKRKVGFLSVSKPLISS